jgi:protein TonB
VFEDSLFATNSRRSPQRGVAAVLSFCVQAVVLGLVVLVPLLYTDALPIGTLKSYVEIPVPPGPRSQQPPTEERRPPRPHASNFENNQLVQPIVIPPRITQLHEDPGDVPPPPGPYVPNSIGGDGNGSPLMRTILASNMHPVPPPPVTTQPKSVRLSSGVTEGLLIRRVTPTYPKMAIITHQQGAVVLQAEIGRDGTIQNLRVISGPPLLVGAAIDAVRQWRYRPYLLNNEPVEVETQITVNFILGG